MVNDAVGHAALEVAIEAAINEGALAVEPIHDAVIDPTEMIIDVIDDAYDDVMRIGMWGISLGYTGTQAEPCRCKSPPRSRRR